MQVRVLPPARMKIYAKYPMTASGVRFYGGAIYGSIKEVKPLGPGAVMFFDKNPAGVFCKSDPGHPLIRYGGGIVLERGSLRELRNWYKFAGCELPRKLKKRIISTKSRLRKEVRREAQEKSRIRSGIDHIHG